MGGEGGGGGGEDEKLISPINVEKKIPKTKPKYISKRNVVK